MDQIQPLKQKFKYKEPKDQPSVPKGEKIKHQFSSSIVINSLFEWKKQKGTIDKKLINLGTKQISMKQITKLKCLSEQVMSGKWKIKISKSDQEEVNFAAGIEESKIGFPIQYVWFSKIITNKLLDMGFNLERNFTQEHKQFYVNQNFSNVFCKGFIYKKSQFFGNWDLRFIVINDEGLFSFKNPSQPHSFSIKAYTANYLWTRFDSVKNSLIIKIKHGVQQTQFAIPMINYCMENPQNWLYAFYRIIMEVNISKPLNPFSSFIQFNPFSSFRI